MTECPCSVESIRLIALGCSGNPYAKENISMRYDVLNLGGGNMHPVELRQDGNAGIDDHTVYDVTVLQFLEILIIEHQFE